MAENVGQKNNIVKHQTFNFRIYQPESNQRKWRRKAGTFKLLKNSIFQLKGRQKKLGKKTIKLNTKFFNFRIYQPNQISENGVGKQ